MYKGLTKRPFSQSSNSQGSSDGEDALGDDIWDRGKKKKGMTPTSLASKGLGLRKPALSSSSSSSSAVRKNQSNVVDLAESDEPIPIAPTPTPAIAPSTQAATDNSSLVLSPGDGGEEVLIDVDADFNDPIYSSAKALLAKVRRVWMYGVVVYVVTDIKYLC
ncbi:hypothetical protein EON63_07270 [archaeon]|nr:MAG: hypothetical protein EON63_07270 [archaeon]